MSPMAANTRPRLPDPVRAVMRRLPRLPASSIFATGLNVTLRRKFPRDVLERLEGYTFVIAVEDAGLELAFLVRRGRFAPVAAVSEPVLRFRAAAWDFAAIAAGTADSDTLFFNRRLVVEGDTEIALLVKNTLDTIEIPRTRKLLRRAMKALAPRSP